MQALAGQLRTFRLADATVACLDSILALLLDAEGNQSRFVQLQGVEKVPPLLQLAGGLTRICACMLR